MNQFISVLKQLPQPHLIASFFTLSVVGFLLYFQKVNRWSIETRAFRIIIFFPLIIELVYQFAALSYGVWSLNSSLPLEFSYISSLSVLGYISKKHKRINGWLYFAGIWSASAAFINTIMFGNETWFVFLRYYGHHGLLLYFGLRSLFWGFRPKRKDYFNAIGLTTIILFFVHLINYVLKTNYMFTYSRPKGANVSQIMPEWPSYILLILGIGVLYYTLLYFLGRQKSQTKRIYAG